MATLRKGAIVTAAVNGGVMDYSRCLANNMVGLTIETIEPEDNLNIVNQIIFLQYSGYGYAKRGAPLWLLRQLQSNRPRIKTLGVFFHELYAFGPPWGSAFWLSPVQRHIARRLAEMSDFWVTNREESGRWLRRFAGDKPHAVLPVFSNVGEMPVYSAQRSPKVVIFGGSALRLATYRATGAELYAWAKQQRLEIHDIGPVISDPIIANHLVAEGVIVHGRLSEAEISLLLADAMYGVVAYAAEYVSKSGVLAAYCAHGISPVLISQHYPESDGLIKSQHYLPGIPKTSCELPASGDIGLAAWNWYQPHRLARHAEVLTRLLGEVSHVR